MAVQLSPVYGVAGQVFNDNGDPLAGGKIYTYLAGTTTNATTYTSSSGAIAHSNPIVLDGAGRVPSGEIWLTDGITYKFVVKDSSDALIGTYDNLTGINSNFVAYTNSQEIQTATAGQTVFNLTTMQYQPGTNSLSVFVDGVNQYGPGASYAYVETDSTTVTFTTGLHVGADVKFTTTSLTTGNATSADVVSYTPDATSLLDGVATTVKTALDDLSNEENGSAYVGFISAGTGAIARTAQSKMRETVSIVDFGAVGDGTTDDTAAIQAALDYASSLGFGFVSAVYIPSGTYVISSDLTIPSYVTVYGDGDQSIIKLQSDVAAGTYNMMKISTDGANSIVLRDFSLWGNNQNQTNNPTVYGIRISPASSPAIYSRLQNLYVKEMNSSALYIDGAGIDNSFVSGCMFRDSKGLANVYVASADKLDFVQCRFRSGKTPGSGHGVLMDNLGNLRVTFKDCRFDDNLGWGLYASNTSDQLTVEGCEFVSNDGGGIYLDRCQLSLVSNNKLSDNGNTSTDSQIRVDTEGQNLISGNLLQGGAGYAIRLKSASNTAVVGNLITARSAVTAFGVYVDTTNGYLIDGNKLYNFGGHGIYTITSDYGAITNNLLTDMGVVTNDTYAGIVIDNNCDYTTVQGNTVVSTATNKVKYGIYIGSASATQTFVTNNSMLGYATAGLQNSGTSTVTAPGNRT